MSLSTFFVVRHGKAMNNIDPAVYKTIPNPEIPLTTTGEQQADSAGDLIINAIKSGWYSDVCIWTSPYKRATQTAKIISEKMNKFSFRTDMLLVEQNYGNAIGHSIESFVEQFPVMENTLYSCSKPYFQLPQGESMANVATRAELFLLKLLLRGRRMEGRHIIVSHQGFCHMFHSQMTGEYTDVWNWKNGEVRVYQNSEYKGTL